MVKQKTKSKRATDKMSKTSTGLPHVTHMDNLARLPMTAMQSKNRRYANYPRQVTKTARTTQYLWEQYEAETEGTPDRDFEESIRKRQTSLQQRVQDILSYKECISFLSAGGLKQSLLDEMFDPSMTHMAREWKCTQCPVLDMHLRSFQIMFRKADSQWVTRQAMDMMARILHSIRALIWEHCTTDCSDMLFPFPSSLDVLVTDDYVPEATTARQVAFNIPEVPVFYSEEPDHSIFSLTELEIFPYEQNKDTVTEADVQHHV